MRTKLKNVLTGRVLEKTFRAGEKIEQVRLDERTYQYLYTDGDLYHFMDKQTYDQTAIGRDVVGDKADWLVENNDAILMFHDEKIIAVTVPLFVELAIAKSDPGVQGDRASGGTKPATLSSGVTINVPLFLNEGDVVKVDTRTAEYIERVS